MGLKVVWLVSHIDDTGPEGVIVCDGVSTGVAEAVFYAVAENGADADEATRFFGRARHGVEHLEHSCGITLCRREVVS